MNRLAQRVVDTFSRHFGAEPDFLVRAPGRVNLIGEHTDYNDGFVLPMAIDRAIWIALRPREDRRVRLYSLDYEEEHAFYLDDYAHAPGTWVEYVQGVAWALQQRGARLRGWEGIMEGDVPIGSGLSSSAALELAVARAFAAVSDVAWDPAAMARVGQAAENGWVGVQCGIMDQMISAAGTAGHALLIDCRTLETKPVPLPPGVRVVVLDTATRRGLVDSAYNERRAQCTAAAEHFGVPALRDVTLDAFTARAEELDEVTRRRARHVIAENERTLAAVEVMRAGDARALGRLMNASHESLRDDFEVSSPALDALVECARAQPGCWGARMTGAGFGGCAVALVEEEAVAPFLAAVAPCYEGTTGRSPAIYVCQATDGAALVPLPWRKVSQ